MNLMTFEPWSRRLALGTLFLVPVLALAHGISDADKQRMLEGGYLQYVGLGATNMLTGYDHLLFLFGVVFFLTTFRDIAKFVTAFTLGHCITLIAATFLQISWNYFLVDALIAISVIYKGFDNNGGFQKHLGMKSPNLLAMVFGFGLLHGFGLSTRLQQLPLGDDKVSMLMRILSFNVGVEVGQIAVPAFAGSAEDCHFHGSKIASQETVTGCAIKRQQTLITSGKIDKSWQAIKPATFEQVDGQRGKEWKVTFKDPAAADQAKQTLYMFFTAQGNFIAVNFTGK